MPDIRSAVSTAVFEIARRKNPALVAVEPRQHLIMDLGFDSLDIADLVSGLELQLGRDPFGSLTHSIMECATVEAFCSAYEPPR